MSGSFLLQGPPELVKAVGPAVLQKINGKGGGRPGRMQGKASALQRAEEARQLIEGAVSDMQQRL
jgi:misacylated tRNA(Ala) deacylase